MDKEAFYANLEIRILTKQAEGYPVELVVDHGQEYMGGYLDPGILPWISMGSPAEDGERLFEALLADDRSRTAWAEVRGQQPQRRLCLRIDASAPELHTIPWELLRDAGTGQYLAAAPDTPFSRYLAGEWDPGEPVTERPVRVLVAVANPADLSKQGLSAINTVSEEQTVRRALDGTGDKEVMATLLEQPVSLDRLEEALQQGYHILHLVAHGKFEDERAVLYLADEENWLHEVDESAFARMLQNLQQSRPRLVYLSSCETAARSPADAWRGLAPRLIQAGVPTVLAMQQQVGMDAAREFAHIFYQQLLETHHVDQAGNAARRTLITAGRPGAAIPVLFSRLPDNRLLAAPRAAMSKTALPDQRYREALMERVRSRWVERLPEQSAQDLPRIPRTIQEQREAVLAAFDELGLPKQVNRTFPPEHSIFEVFEQAGEGMLLILGAPRSGKTTALLELARDALVLAERDAARPIPVILTLDRWSDPNQALVDWLAAELDSQYGVPQQIGRPWLETDRLLLLLDGLEAVEPARRAACVKAINASLATLGLSQMAVTCDAGAYEELGVRLRLNTAIRLAPLAQGRAGEQDLAPQVDLVDLEIHIDEPRADRYPISLTVDGTRQFEGEPLSLAALPALSDPLPAQYGVRLFRWLFADPTLRREWEGAHRRGRHVQLRLRIDPDTPQLHDQLWELMRPAPAAPALAFSESVSFHRYRPGQRAVPRPVDERPIRVLVAVAGPDELASYGRAPIEPAEERRLMTQALFGIDRTELSLAFTDPGRPLTLPTLEESLRRGCHILHLVGYGVVSSQNGEAAMLMADGTGRARPVPVGQVADMVANLIQKPQLVVLSHPQAARESSAPAWRRFALALLEAGVAIVQVAQALPPEDQAFEYYYSFNRAWYRQLVDHGHVGQAVRAANVAWPDASPEANVAPPAILSRLADTKVFAQPAPPEAETQDRRNQLILLDRVHSFWVEEVLEASLHDVAAIELGMEAEVGAVERPWEMTLDVAGQPDETLPAGQYIVDIFDQLGASLLILGAPGSGKTFTLLELARDLISRAERDANHPMPVVFNLSSWPGPPQSLAEWMVDELSLKYQIPRKIGRPWVEGHKVLPLLDGLDEVRESDRAGCVAAINQFREEHSLVGMAVCSRTEEYVRLRDEHHVRLALGGAIRLQPLSARQVDEYLEAAGPQLAAVRTTLEHDTALQELAQTPLMLNVMMMAYQGKSEAELVGRETMEDRRRHLFGEYVDGMFQRTMRTEYALYPKEQAIHWLTWLAQRLSRQGASLFLIEHLQVSWLQTYQQRRFFALAYYEWWGLVAFIVFVPAFSAFMGFFGLFFSLCCAAPFIAVGLLFNALIEAGNVSGKVFKRRAMKEIELAESIHWSWPGALKAVGLGVALGLLSLGQSILFDRLGQGEAPFGISPIYLVLNGVLWGLLIGIFRWGLVRGGITETVRPNQGITQSLKYTLILCTGASVAFGALGGLVLAQAMPFPPLVLMLFGGYSAFGIAFAFSGEGVLKHYLLRITLSRYGCMPRKYADFLDYAAERVFLRKVGGGYIFVHRLLQDYFASLETENRVDA